MARWAAPGAGGAEVKLPKLGPTGTYPRGKLSPDDEGGLLLAVGADEHGNVKIKFGKKVAWIGLNSEQAIQFAMMILKKAGFTGSVIVGPGGNDAEDTGGRGQGDQKVEPWREPVGRGNGDTPKGG
jgi:hypothetical protein